MGHMIGYSLPILLVVNAINIVLFAKSKEYNILGKQVLNTFAFCIFACLIYLGLISLDIVSSIYSYVFLYMVFPYIFLLLLGYIFFLAKEKQLKKSKSIFRKMFFLLIMLTMGFILSHFFN